MPSGFFYFNSFDRFISYQRDVWLFLLLPCFVEIPAFNANDVDPDQTPRSATFDLDLYCLPISLLWDARLKWVKIGSAIKIKNRMANSVNPDVTARYEPSHLDLHCLQMYLFWSVGQKGLINSKDFKTLRKKKKKKKKNRDFGLKQRRVHGLKEIGLPVLYESVFAVLIRI